MLKVPVRGAAKAIQVVHEQLGENGMFYLGLAVLVVLLVTRWRQGVREMDAEDLQRGRKGMD